MPHIPPTHVKVQIELGSINSSIFGAPLIITTSLASIFISGATKNSLTAFAFIFLIIYLNLFESPWVSILLQVHHVLIALFLRIPKENLYALNTLSMLGGSAAKSFGPIVA